MKKSPHDLVFRAIVGVDCLEDGDEDNMRPFLLDFHHVFQLALRVTRQMLFLDFFPNNSPFSLNYFLDHIFPRIFLRFLNILCY